MLLIVDIHFNAGGGQGFEVYYSRVGGTSKTLGISTAASPANTAETIQN
ncbi:MAG: hypothetical protein ACLUV3_12830 [Oscillospiraceae bacterium]